MDGEGEHKGHKFASFASWLRDSNLTPYGKNGATKVVIIKLRYMKVINNR
jgi:hypothetical protein